MMCSFFRGMSPRRGRHRACAAMSLGLWVIGLANCGLPLCEAAAPKLDAPIENFELRDFYGKTHQLSDYAAQQMVVIIFVGDECPLVRLYATRLMELAAEFGPRGVVFVGINSNRQDTLTEMAAFARQTKLEFPLLKDSDNTVADRLGAMRTPRSSCSIASGEFAIRGGSMISLESAISARRRSVAIWRSPSTSCLPAIP